MGAAGDLLLTFAGVLVVLCGSIEVATACLLAFWLLVPGLLSVPYGPHLLLVDRLILYAFALRLVVRAGRAANPRRVAYALTPVHAALAALCLAAFFAGVIFAPSSVSLAGDLHAFFYVLDMPILFVVVLAAVRTIGIRRIVNLITWGVLAVVVIGFVERFTKFSWGHFFFEHLPASYVPDIAPGTLSIRGAAVRSQGAAQFALEYGWVLAMLLPLTVAATIRWGRGWGLERKAALAIPVAAFVAIVFSGGRSAVIAALLGTVVFLLVAGNARQLRQWIAVVAVAAVVVALIDPSLLSAPFSAGSASDPTSVRLDRLPVLFSLVVHRPFTGLGFNGVSGVFGGVDNGYALTYATIGVVGLTAWVALMVTSLVAMPRAQLAPRGSETRTIGAACMIGIALVAFAMATYDLVATLQSQWVFMVLAALGVAAAERVPLPARSRRRWFRRALLPLAGLGAGLLVFAVAPLSSSQTSTVVLTAPWLAYTNGGPIDSYDGTALTDTFCGALTSPEVIAPGSQIECLQDNTIQPFLFPAQATVTVRAPTPAAVLAATHRAIGNIASHEQMIVSPTGPIETGRPALAETAPFWCAALGVLVMTLVPPLARRRRATRRAPPAREELYAGAPDVPELSGVGV